MKTFVIKSLHAVTITLSLLAFSSTGQEAKNLDELLQAVKAGGVKEARENRQREQSFARNKSQQKQLLAQLEKDIAEQEQLSEKLEKQFEENDQKIAEAEARLKERMGSLGELFGHITSAAGDARGNLATSLVSIEFPNRDTFFSDLIDITSSGNELPNIEQIEQLWFELQREMVEQGKVVKLQAEVAHPEGMVNENIVRIGTFNVINQQGEYLQFNDGRLSILPRQPSNHFTNEAKTLAGLTSGHTKVGIDPTGPSGGSLLAALIDTPTLMERWHQGGIVGYVITFIGFCALLLAIWRLLVLMGVRGKVSRQLKSDALSADNPLGRVLKEAESAPAHDTEAMELKLNEAILKELPRLTSGEALLKIIAAVAPLLGLLGTVTGMILTFQAITIYGAGDPKAMAGGISSALITTVLGLIVAIPTIVLHTFVSSSSKGVIHILEEQAAGIVASHQEKSA
ncbi:MAG: MotA/TolQ/ExbB proton channel family protein [Cellvibrionales bacterium]|nr:MotA/TolQ/ExbB proton channel family protein [Cellvibrionales bacterium]